MPKLSLSARFALLFLGGVLPLLLLLGGLVYVEYRAFLREEYVAGMRALVHAVVDPPVYVDRSSPLPALSELGSLLADQLEGTHYAAMTLDADGLLVAASVGAEFWLAAAQEAVTSGQAVADGQSSVRTLKTPSGSRIAYLLPVVAPDRAPLGTIVVSFPTSIVQAELQRLAVWLLFAIGGVVGLALLLTPLLARAAARPVQGLVTTAQSVTDGALDRRAPPSTVREFQTLTDAFNAMLDRLEQTLQTEKATATTLRRFAADAAHELRSPLAVLGSGMEVWQMSRSSRNELEAEQMATLVQAEIEHMQRLVDDLLFLARLDNAREHSSHPLNLTEVDALPLLEEVAERAEVLAKGQQIRLRWPQTEMAPVLADEELVRRALNNLVENALRYTPPGRSITLEAIAKNDGCTFKITDQGQGIDAEHLPKLFDRFYQVDGARTRQGNSGLGLSIVQAIVQAHGGSIQVESTVGVGTTVELWLPATVPTVTVSTVTVPTAASQSTQAQPAPERATTATLHGVAEADATAQGAGPRYGLILIGVATLLLASLIWRAVITAGAPPPGAVADDRAAADVVVALLATPTVASPVATSPVAVTATGAPSPTAAALPLPGPAAVEAVASRHPFTVATELAQQALADEGEIVQIERESKDGVDYYEVTFISQTEIALDPATAHIRRIRAGDRVAQTRGTQERLIRQARLAALLAQSSARISFGAAAEAAQRALDTQNLPEEIELVWQEEGDRLLYVVEFDAAPDLWLDPFDGTVLMAD